MENANDMRTLLGLLSGLGVCRTGRRYLRRSGQDFDTLVKVWRGWPEFLAEHSVEALAILRENLTEEDKEMLAQERLFLDRKGVYVIDDASHPIFAVGDCDIRITVPDYSVVKLYVFNGSTVTCGMGNQSILNVEAYDRSYVSVDGVGRECRSTAYRYDGAVVEGAEKTVDKEYVRGEVFNGKEYRGRDV